MMVDLRISTFPTIYGEKIVIRILLNQRRNVTLYDLGFSDGQLARVETAIRQNYGLILCTGPTGSGKSTSLFSMIKTYDPSKVNIATLEDPVEYRLPGVNHTQIHSEIGFGFADGLRSLVRQDVDIVMVGEIRDQETADLAIDASLTGHSVFSTIHANSAAATITRLLNMGIEPFLLASSLKLIIAQRLIRKVCEHCRQQTVPSPALMQRVQDEIGHLTGFPVQQIVFYEANGCPACNGTGYNGRIGLYEIINLTPGLKELIIAQASEKEIEIQAKKDGMLTLQQDALLKASVGITSLQEAFYAGINFDSGMMRKQVD